MHSIGKGGDDGVSYSLEANDTDKTFVMKKLLDR